MKKSKRILWICNHATLTEAECGLLVSLGYEVFVPKILPDGGEAINSRTAAINYDFDKTLTIAPRDLDAINKFNFYSSVPSEEIVRIINKHFGIMIMVPLYPGCFYMAQVFKGKYVLRVFGHGEKINYELVTTYIDDMPLFKSRAKLLFDLMNKFKTFRPREITHFNKIMFAYYMIKNRFFMGAGYDNIAANEPQFFRNRAIFLPLGIPESIWKHRNTWKGQVNKIMFVCPSIENGYYRAVYDNFIANFSDLPYSIFGRQNKDIMAVLNNPNILGFVPREVFDESMREYKCMFYHSREPRHLHYHPLEAIVWGMPLIYMSGGLLERFGGPQQPGMAKTFEEAREKLLRILNGDEKFTADILAAQPKILDEFKDDFIKRVWIKSLERVAGRQQ